MINTIGIFRINPSLQAAALRMTGVEFSAFTEQARNHLLEGDRDKLTRLLAGKQIEYSSQALVQIVTARSIFFGEVPPHHIFDNSAFRPTPASSVDVDLDKVFSALGFREIERADPVRKREYRITPWIKDSEDLKDFEKAQDKKKT